jgi:hypothetical protein
MGRHATLKALDRYPKTVELHKSVGTHVSLLAVTLMNIHDYDSDFNLGLKHTRLVIISYRTYM